MTPKVGLLLGLKNIKVGVTGRFWPCPIPTPKPVPDPTGTFSTSALVALISWSSRSAVWAAFSASRQSRSNLRLLYEGQNQNEGAATIPDGKGGMESQDFRDWQEVTQ